MWILLCALLGTPTWAAPQQAPVSLPGAAAAPSPAASASPATATDPALEAEIRRLLVLTGAEQLATQMLDQMLTSMRATVPQVPPAVWDEVRAEMRPSELVDATVAIYARRFTAEEIAALITFYESPVGRKLIAEQPGIVAESMAMGQEWGVAAAQRAMVTLKARGVVF